MTSLLYVVLGFTVLNGILMAKWFTEVNRKLDAIKTTLDDVQGKTMWIKEKVYER